MADDGIVFAPPRRIVKADADSDGDHQPLDEAKVQEFLREREMEVSRRLEAIQALDSEKGGHVNNTKSPRTLEPVAFAAPRIRHEKVDWEVPQYILDRLAQACDEDPQGIHARAQASKFAWSGVVDAAKAAWIGGTELLTYGELLPAGTEKALAVMAPGLHFEFGAPKRQHEIALELGCGRGRAALHLFLAGATVLGVELALERYNKAIENIERLAHRCPDAFRVDFQNSKARLICTDATSAKYNSVLELRYGDFFQLVEQEEIVAATLIFLQVRLPSASWPRVRSLLDATSPGCRVLSQQDLREVYRGAKPPFPFRDIGSPVLECTWAPMGHRFHCYERLDLEEENRILQRAAAQNNLKSDAMSRTKMFVDPRSILV